MALQRSLCSITLVALTLLHSILTLPDCLCLQTTGYLSSHIFQASLSLRQLLSQSVFLWCIWASWRHDSWLTSFLCLRIDRSGCLWNMIVRWGDIILWRCGHSKGASMVCHDACVRVRSLDKGSFLVACRACFWGALIGHVCKLFWILAISSGDCACLALTNSESLN